MEDGRKLLRVASISFPVEFAAIAVNEVVGKLEMEGVDLTSVGV